MRFKDKVVIITGGASGIGEETTVAFAGEGAYVVVADFSEEKGRELTERLNSGNHRAHFIKTDVTKEDDVIAMVKECTEHFGRVDVLFANAGMAHDSPIVELRLEDWQKTIDVNLTGVFLCCKHVIRQMLRQGGGGTIVNCGSIHSHVGKGGVTAYAASKGGVKLLTQTLCADYAQHGIRVNAICPGYIDTPLLKHLPIYAKQQLVKLHPQGRLGRADEVASVVLFLASDDASFVNGTTILVDGGYTTL